MLRFDVLTLFPDMVAPVLGQSMLKRAQEKGLLQVTVRNLRDFADDRHKVADDVPYGGGAGMVMKAEPILRAVDVLREEAQACGETIRLLFPSPHGRPFTQDYAQRLSQEVRRIVILCGHYEGVDERVIAGRQLEEVSVGDYILSGGEIAALAVILARDGLLVLGTKFVLPRGYEYRGSIDRTVPGIAASIARSRSRWPASSPSRKA